MKTPRLFSLFALALAAAAPVLAPGCTLPTDARAAVEPQPPPNPGSEPSLGLEKFAVRARFDPEVARAGETVRLVLQATTAPGWHAYGSREEGNVPVALDHGKVTFGALAPVGEPTVPPGDERQLHGTMQYPLPSTFEVVQLVQVPAAATAGTVTVTGMLDYQICDENSCEAPSAASFATALTIEAGEARALHLPVPATSSVGHTIVLDDRGKAIEVATAADKLLLYNFTGFNCASCRGVEGHVFLDPAVAATMAAHFVEARLHIDTQNTLTDAQFADNRKAQADLAGTVATPYFVVVDPKTGAKISEHALSGGPSAWTPGWVEFLADTLAKAGR